MDRKTEVQHMDRKTEAQKMDRKPEAQKKDRMNEHRENLVKNCWKGEVHCPRGATFAENVVLE